MASLYDDLKSEIANGHVLAIVGSGVSLAATANHPLASWKGLLLHGVDHCVEYCQPLPAGWAERRRDELADGNLNELLSAAENIAVELGAPGGGEYRNWLRETVGELKVTVRSEAEALRDLGVLLATTNYDGLLEELTGLPPVTWRDGAKVERMVRGDEKGILHLHGYWEDPESVILSIRSYEKVLGDAHAQAMQQALRATRTLLFIGCGAGMADPNFEALRRWSREVFRTSEYRHFRLCLDSELAGLQQEHPPEERIFPLSYGVAHNELAEYLRSLKPAAPAHPIPTGPISSGKRRLPGRRNCFGREGQIADLVDSLCTDPPPPVPILGQAGIGKSTVLIEALHHPRVEARYGDHRIFVSCGSATDRESLVGEIARHLGVEPGPQRDSKLFDELDRTALVLALDDAETAYWSETAAVEELLSQFGTLSKLALAISLRGEQRPFGPRWREAIRLLPLPRVPARDAFLAVAGGRFQNDPDLERLLDVLDGWPLALNLLAHQAELEPNLSSLWELWVAKRTELLRLHDNKSRLNIDLSLGLSIDSPCMTEDARRLLSLLSVLPEGIVLDCLNALFPQAPDAAPILRKVGLALDDAGRIRALAPVREYVREKHPVTHQDLQHAVTYYLRWAQETQKTLEANALELSRNLAQEFGNLEALVIASLTPPASEPDSTDGASEKIRSVLSLGSLLTSTGLSMRAPRIVGKALQRAAEIGDERLKLDCLILLGDIARVHANWEEARCNFAASVELSRKLNSTFLEAVGISKLGAVEEGYSNLAPARHYYEEARHLFAEMEKTDEEGQCVLGLAKIHRECRELDAAESKAREAMALFERTGTELGTANCLTFLAEIALEVGNPSLANERIEVALEIYEKRASALGRANCLKNLARVALQSADEPAALTLFLEALDLYKLIGNQKGEGECLLGLGDLKRESDPDTARARYEAALSILTQVGDPLLIGRGHVLLSGLAALEGERLQHIEAARNAWYRIGRFDLAEGLDREPGNRSLEAPKRDLGNAGNLG